MYKKEKTLGIITLLCVLGLISLVPQIKAQPRFVIASWEYPSDDYGQGIEGFEFFENSTGSWIQVGSMHWYNETGNIYNWTAGVAIKLRCWTSFNSSFMAAENGIDIYDTNSGKPFQQHNVTVENNDVTIFSQQNFTFYDCLSENPPEEFPMWEYLYDVVLNFIPAFGEFYTVTVRYELFFNEPTIEDYIDAQSNVDSHADHGTHDVFNDLKATDATMDLMSEADTGPLSQTAGNTAETDLGYRNLSTNYADGGLITTSASGGTVTDVHIRCYGSGGSGSGKALIVLHSNLNIISNGVSNPTAISASVEWHTFTFSTPPTLAASTEYVLFIVSSFNFIRLMYADTSSTNYGHADNTNNYATPINPTDATHDNDNYEMYVHYSGANYESNLEMAFTSVLTTYTEYELCIKTGTHASGSEAFNVRIWDGAWDTVITGLNWSAWNNVSVTAYKNATMYVLFVGQSDSGDGTQDTFNVDSVLLTETNKTWNEAGTAVLTFWTSVDVILLNGLFIVAGLIMIPGSVIYLIAGGTEGIDTKKLFFFFIVFLFGWALFLGVIAPP